jgi:hypothetical protein
VLRVLLERERRESVRGEDLTMKREVIIATLIRACVVASYQAFEVEVTSGNSMEQASRQVTPRFQQQGYVGVHLSGTLREFSVTAAGQP